MTCVPAPHVHWPLWTLGPSTSYWEALPPPGQLSTGRGCRSGPRSQVGSPLLPGYTPTRNLKLGGRAVRTLQPHTQPYPPAGGCAPGWQPRAAARLAGPPPRTATQCLAARAPHIQAMHRPASRLHPCCPPEPSPEESRQQRGAGLPTPHSSRRPCPPIWLCPPLSICPPLEVSAECSPSLHPFPGPSLYLFTGRHSQCAPCWVAAQAQECPPPRSGGEGDRGGHGVGAGPGGRVEAWGSPERRRVRSQRPSWACTEDAKSVVGFEA